jgi:hypothetical protein
LQYQAYKDVFENKNIDTCYININHMIMLLTLRREHNTHSKPIYNLSEDEPLELQKYIDENLKKRFI